jgi:hypothetical protein
MKIFIEGEKYSIDILREAFDDNKFYTQVGLDGIISSVGYYRSTEKNNLVFLLPKVFMRDESETVFGLSKSQIIDLNATGSITHKFEYNWIRQLSVHFYNSLIEYRKRKYNPSTLHLLESYELNTNVPDFEFSYLDLYLTIINFYKKNKDLILFKHIEFISDQVKKPKWERTVRKSLPFLLDSKPIYVQLTNKRKIADKEEQLITYFLSIVNHFNTIHDLNLKIDKAYTIIKGKAFETLCEKGIRKLQKIKYRYFSDVLRRMYRLCEIFFSYHNSSSVKKKRDEFLAVSNYNIVFEDMIDKLFTDKPYLVETKSGISIQDLKNNPDGKILDHIYDYSSLIDTTNIFYIGDSKYYKSGNKVGSISRYKQFTYAKNIIQFNIDLLTEGNMIPNIRYRDELTDGYNLSPNFFLFGYISAVNDYTNHEIKIVDNVVASFHYQDRLFDRDTLFIHQYKINFLFVLKAYTTFSPNSIDAFRKAVKKKFRDHFIDYFSDKDVCKFDFFEFNGAVNKDQFILENFRVLVGKLYNTAQGKLLLAKYKDDHTIDESLLSNFLHIDNFHHYVNQYSALQSQD